MEVARMLLTHTEARATHRSPFFFSRFNFARMQDRGNTHFCFYCAGRHGFTPDDHGNATNHMDGKHDTMPHHDPIAHADGIIGKADKYNSAYVWLEKEISRKTRRTPLEWLARKPKQSFPFVVSIT